MTLSFLTTARIETPLGLMIAIADHDFLYLLEFEERISLGKEIEHLQNKMRSVIVSGHTKQIDSIENELSSYFKGKLIEFLTPVFMFGTPFQRRVWEALRNIPFGETRSYSELANAIGRPTACRAVARANSANQLALIIPCHRVINSSGEVGGYAGGVPRKIGLIRHEKQIVQSEFSK